MRTASQAARGACARRSYVGGRRRLPCGFIRRLGACGCPGDRVFPATMAVDDPGVGDEFDFQYGHIKSPTDDGDNMNVNTASFEWDKLITSNLAFSIASAYVTQNAPNGGSAKGFDNITLGLKYLAYSNPRHEFMASVGMLTELGGTGARAIGDSSSTITPTVYFGKGFGDLSRQSRFPETIRDHG